MSENKPMTWQQWVNLLRKVRSETIRCMRSPVDTAHCFYTAWYSVRSTNWWKEVKCKQFGSANSSGYFKKDPNRRLTVEHIDAIFNKSIDWAIAEAAKEGVVVK